MKNERIYEAIGAVDDELLSRCEAAGKQHRPIHWRRWSALAACLCVFIIGAVIINNLYPKGMDLPTGTDDLPILTISANDGAMGYEGYMAYDISELVNENPWSVNADLPNLPVYKNTLAYDENYDVPGASMSNMRKFMLDIATRMGLDKKSLTITGDGPDEAIGENVPTSITAEQNGIKITVSNQMIATIQFTPAVSLPDDYQFSHYASYEETAAVAKYLKEQYRDLFDMKNVQADVSGGGYNIYGQQGYSISFFDGSGNLDEQMMNYYFHRIDFYSDDHDDLFLIRIYQQDLSEKLGDYPIITTDAAAELLESGYYFTSVFEVMGEVASVELVYRNGSLEEYYMPYYRFLIELPEVERENGLKTYGAFYVPAIEQQYISSMTVWDGRFN